MIQPVILCGGKGSRLWPLSRESYPKQFLTVGSEKTLFQETVLRAAALGNMAPPVAMCGEELRFLVAEQLLELEVKGDIVLEPESKNTAPAVAISALLKKDKDPLLLVMPADHIIKDKVAFKNSFTKAVKLAEKNFLVTFGIIPDHPETAFGYLHRGTPVDEGFQVLRFEEKPTAEVAAQYYDSGEYFWNSGIFLFRASAFLRELEKYAPGMLTVCEKTLAESLHDLDFFRLSPSEFAKCPEDSIDYAVMEKTDKCVMVELDAGWNDLGTWSSLYLASQKDENNNVLHGDVISSDTQNCYLHSENRLLAAIGLKDIVAVETSDAVFVAHMDKAQDVKKMVESLTAKKRHEVIHHRKVYRPWGTYESTDTGLRYQVKCITVNPGQILSLQMHHHRAEHWVVVHGTAKITNGEKEFMLTEDQSTYIPVGTKHRLENPGKIPLELIEIQTGAYLGEDDIVRFEDLYGRYES
ncbi:mannose-1-phosphate guanylyltransferase/mannose-6-phosphate isomerase [Maridesulfovibrio zosterae]|uniref:mannose-1-phosphate guanylyltransferase/mannose-6-phosphate isomerase n=1 Tax=Maridesulfovibrio zosterae TaxID=82171 RepID=UPI0004257BFC|nr:mannose-1-phosphate guanylyltransferase/mannose-6-phosphate isomerase [Maridesulfovibrio zosterae]